MIITHIDDIPIHAYPVYKSMLDNTLVRFSKWECAKYWERKGRSYNETMKMYDMLIGNVDKIIYSSLVNNAR
jgi:hypothetical protein